LYGTKLLRQTQGILGANAEPDKSRNAMKESQAQSKRLLENLLSIPHVMTTKERGGCIVLG
jgi:hypothetical protein